MAAPPNSRPCWRPSAAWHASDRQSGTSIYLGDLIDRGPDRDRHAETLGRGAAAQGVDHIDRLMGNHEIMMLLTLAGGAHAAEGRGDVAEQEHGRREVLAEMRAAVAARAAHADQALLAGLGEDVVHRLMRNDRISGSAIPCSFMAASTRRPIRRRSWRRPGLIFTDARWAWITHGFLDWQAGFGGTLVVHGHTPPDKHRAISGMDDPHLFEGDRLSLDGGSARTGIVTAAEIQDGRYRILKAGTARPTAGEYDLTTSLPG